MSVLVLNAGSSTVKFSLRPDASGKPVADGVVELAASGEGERRAILRVHRRHAAELNILLPRSDAGVAVEAICSELAADLAKDPPEAVGHRVVHGGSTFTEPTRIDEPMLKKLRELSELAPLHNPPAIAAIEAARRRLPAAPHVAVFDTAFFAGLAPERFLYPLPYAWHTAWGIRRFGFHGISHAYCARRAGAMLGPRPRPRILTCHLGNGCSAAATLGEHPIATTMGFSTLEGLMMGTRPGNVDAGILLYLLETRRLSQEQLEHALYHESGLVGISGVSSDFRKVQEAADAGHAQASLALAMYAESIRSTIGSLVVALGGIDALVFTAGVGEHAAGLRARVCQGLDLLGIRLDPERNLAAKADVDIATVDSPARILVLHTREEEEIAQAALELAHGH